MTDIIQQASGGHLVPPDGQIIRNEYMAALAAAERERTAASDQAVEAYYSVMQPARRRYDAQVTQAWKRYKLAMDMLFGLGTSHFRCCDGALLPWPTDGADVRCPDCGTVWEWDGVTIGGGARIKTPGTRTAPGEIPTPTLPAGS